MFPLLFWHLGRARVFTSLLSLSLFLFLCVCASLLFLSRASVFGLCVCVCLFLHTRYCWWGSLSKSFFWRCVCNADKNAHDRCVYVHVSYPYLQSCLLLCLCTSAYWTWNETLSISCNMLEDVYVSLGEQCEVHNRPTAKDDMWQYGNYNKTFKIKWATVKC